MRLAIEHGEVVCYGDDFDLKIASDRTIYFKRKGEGTFTSSGRKVPYGLPAEAKKAYLVECYRGVLELRQMEGK